MKFRILLRKYHNTFQQGSQIYCLNSDSIEDARAKAKKLMEKWIGKSMDLEKEKSGNIETSTGIVKYETYASEEDEKRYVVNLAWDHILN